MTKTPRTIINYSVEEETEEKILEMCQLTKRNPGNLIDWVVSEAYIQMKRAAREITTIEEAMLSQDGG
jgi:hypothetical protein